ncbi:carbohydrate porin [Vibrio crassostreae]|uniref:carbohydrate porin n=1 Tax=Vibrio crassostreae TaxID=246167 RepID=UPI001B30FBBB|nr:carbohydrate porin [Vibrio crassostreae]
MKRASIVLALTTTVSVYSAEATTNSTFENTLTQDWSGARTHLTESGVTVNAEYTNVYQAPLNTTPNDRSNTSHRFDLFTQLDFAALGLWQGGKLNTQVIASTGKANDFGLIQLSSPNSTLFAHDDSVMVTSFNYNHELSPATLLMIGKFDAIEMMRPASFYGGGTRHGFMNLAFTAPPSGVVPPSFFGVIANHKVGNTLWSAMVFDPRDRYTENLNSSGLFDDGVSASLGFAHFTQLFDRQTLLSLNYAYSTEKGADFSSLTPDLNFDATAQYKYNARFQLSHNLVERAGNPTESWGLHLRGSLADGNPNVFNATFAGGLGGKALFFDRPTDTWGLGYYYYDLSDDLQDSINALPTPYELRNEQGFEAYYAYEPLPWLTITTDIQYVTSALNTQDKAWLAGIRTNIRF